ncbi:MAG: hypothetical protein AAGA99_08535 [Actinomycetota bacterium]
MDTAVGNDRRTWRDLPAEPPWGDGGTPTPPPGPAPESGADDGGSTRRAAIVAVVATLLVAVIATALYLALRDDEEATAGPLFDEPIAEVTPGLGEDGAATDPAPSPLDDFLGEDGLPPGLDDFLGDQLPGLEEFFGGQLPPNLEEFFGGELPNLDEFFGGQLPPELEEFFGGELPSLEEFFGGELPNLEEFFGGELPNLEEFFGGELPGLDEFFGGGDDPFAPAPEGGSLGTTLLDIDPLPSGWQVSATAITADDGLVTEAISLAGPVGPVEIIATNGEIEVRGDEASVGDRDVLVDRDDDRTTITWTDGDVTIELTAGADRDLDELAELIEAIETTP